MRDLPSIRIENKKINYYRFRVDKRSYTIVRDAIDAKGFFFLTWLSL
jgi:hypothetical protein